MRLSIQTAGLTDPGLVRANNEDALCVDESLGLLLVADGMGGHKAGEVASGIAIKAIPDQLRQLGRKGTARTDPAAETNRLGLCLETANQMIFEAANSSPDDSGMGTTCTAALITGDRLSVAHVGDTRCYLFRHGQLEQLTEDHSLAMEQLKHGLISKEQVGYVNQNVLTRSLGTQPEVKIDLGEHPLLPGDVLLLCSDGLGKELTDEQVTQAIMGTPEPAELVRRLVDQANAAGGRDNITVAVARIRKASWADWIRSLFR
jgi:serine/threonine protein phosphatase PrpC